MIKSKHVLSVFSLVMINVIAVDSLRTLAITATLGLPLVVYYLIAAVVFFVPVALVAAELATAYPHKGGIYIWVREAFGIRIAFMSIWLQWIYNVVWYPLILAFIAATFAYLISPALANNNTYLLLTMLVLFWSFTLLNCFGMKISSMISVLGAVFGTLLPMIGIAILGLVWLWQGHPIEINQNTSFWPDFSCFGNFSIFSAVLFGLLGMEMSAVHADEVRDPQRDYPRALLYSTIIIFATLVIGSLAIIMIVPENKLSVVSGAIDAYALFFKAYHMSWMLPITAMFIILGGLSGVSAWLIGPTKGLLVAAHDRCLPEWFTHVNRHGAPVKILVIQGILFTILSSLFLLVDSLNAAYVLLNNMCAQLALLVYVLMFAAAIKLRYTQPKQPRAYKIPGGKIGIWIVAGTGLFCCIFTIILSFVPPTQIPIDNIVLFEFCLFASLIFFVMIPWFISRQYIKKSRK